MKQNIFKLSVVSLATVLFISYPNFTQAQVKKIEVTEKKAEATETAKQGDATRKLPFHGKVVSVDKVAKTIKVSSRTFKVMPDTQITKAEKPATLDDAVIGEVTGGSYKNNDGTLELVKIRLGPKAEDIVKAAVSRPATAAIATKPVVKK